MVIKLSLALLWLLVKASFHLAACAPSFSAGRLFIFSSDESQKVAPAASALQPDSGLLLCVRGDSPVEQPGGVHTHSARRTFVSVDANTLNVVCSNFGVRVQEEEESLNYPWWLCCRSGMEVCVCVCVAE